MMPPVCKPLIAMFHAHAIASGMAVNGVVGERPVCDQGLMSFPGRSMPCSFLSSMTYLSQGIWHHCTPHERPHVPVFHGGCQLLFRPLSVLQAVKQEHLSNFCTNVMAEVKIADQHAAQPCQTGQHFIKEEPIRMLAPTIKTDVLAPLFATDSGQEVPLASDAVKQEATCFAFSTCSQNGATASFWQDDSQAVSGCSPQVVSEEAIADHRDMLTPPVAHSSGTASQSVKVQDEASSQGMVPPTTEAESGADPSSVKVFACVSQCHGKLVIAKCTQCFVSGVQAATYLVLTIAW